MNNADTTIPMAQPPISSSTGSQPQETLLQRGAFDPPSTPGTLGRLDRFEILRLLGEGGMGQVYLAREPLTDTQVAIKIMRPQMADDPQAVHGFLTEARHMYRLSHPRILRVLEVSDRKAGPYYVMPHIAGGSLLGQYRPGEPMSTERTLSIARQVAEALAHAHAHGLIHRDIKPGNVLLDKEGNAYLTDFGLVRTVFNDSMVDASASHLEGTAPYMSPAVAQGEAEDTRCDIYAFGALLYELLTGQPPYTGRTSQLILDQVLKGPPQPIRAVWPKASPALVKIAEGCMARELRDRYASMADVVADLDRASKGQAPFGSLRQQRRRPVRLAAALLSVVLLAGMFSLAPSLLKSRKENVTPPIPPSAPLQKKAALSEKCVGQHVNEASDPNMTQAERKAVTLTKPYPTSYKGATTDKIAVQYAVIELGKQAGLNYNWDESFKNTDPICKEWVYPDIKNMPFRTAMKELLGPVGLTYELRENTILLKRDSESDTNRTDWGKEFGGRPTAVWNPEATDDADAMPAAARAIPQTAKVQVPFTYTITNGAATIVKYTGSGGAVTIPSAVTGLPVVGIGDNAFKGCTNLTGVAIPDTVTRIGRFAFSGCTGLTHVTIPASVTVIDVCSFNGCSRLLSISVEAANSAYSSSADGVLFDKARTSLVSYPAGKAGNYVIPGGVTSIGVSAFSDCGSLTGVEFPSGLTSIGACAFDRCPGLTRVTIPQGVTSIGGWAFQGCSSLTRITIPASVTSIGRLALYRCKNLAGVYFEGDVPPVSEALFFPNSNTTIYFRPGTKGWGKTFNGLPTAVWDGGAPEADDTLSADTLAIPAVTKTQGPFTYTVANSAVTITKYTGPGGEVVIPKEINGLPVTTIGDSAFIYRRDVTVVSIPDNVTRIGSCAFLECTGLTQFILPDSVTNVGFEALAFCDGLTRMEIPKGVTSFTAIRGCRNLVAFVVDTKNPVYWSSPDGVLFNKEKTTLINCPGGKTGVYRIPDTVKEISWNAFKECAKLTQVTLPNGLTNIGDYAFADCAKLTGITLPASVVSVGYGLFFRNTELSAIAVDATNPAYRERGGVLFNKTGFCLVSCPAGKAGRYTVPDGVLEIARDAFGGCLNLTSVTLPASVMRIGQDAFARCGESLTAVYVNGDAPQADTDVFVESKKVTVYYRPVTTGWGLTFGGRPTKEWKP